MNSLRSVQGKIHDKLVHLDVDKIGRTSSLRDCGLYARDSGCIYHYNHQ